MKFNNNIFRANIRKSLFAKPSSSSSIKWVGPSLSFRHSHIEGGIVVFPYVYKHNSLLVNDLAGV